MAKTLGCMITWTTYGSWLQGDKRGYVKKGVILPASEQLEEANRKLQVQRPVRLSKVEQQLVRQAILKEAVLQGRHIYALAVRPMHVHIVAQYIAQPISKVVAYYKKAARLALKNTGHNGKLWTKGYDKRFCFDQDSLVWNDALNMLRVKTPRETWG